MEDFRHWGVPLLQSREYPRPDFVRFLLELADDRSILIADYRYPYSRNTMGHQTQTVKLRSIVLQFMIIESYWQPTAQASWHDAKMAATCSSRSITRSSHPPRTGITVDVGPPPSIPACGSLRQVSSGSLPNRRYLPRRLTSTISSAFHIGGHGWFPLPHSRVPDV